MGSTSRQSAKYFPHIKALNPHSPLGPVLLRKLGIELDLLRLSSRGQNKGELSSPRWASNRQESRLRPHQSCHQAAARISFLRNKPDHVTPPRSPPHLRPSKGRATRPSMISPERNGRPPILASREPFFDWMHQQHLLSCSV